MERLCIIDLEATCWEARAHKPEEMETIEIGAVLCDVETGKKIDEIDIFITPVRHPQLSEFCRNLTSIRQEQVDAAHPFPIAFKSFLSWLGDTDNIEIASWGAYDLAQLRRDCEYHGISYPFEDRYLNLKKIFGKLHGGRRFGMKRALQLCGLELIGTHHRGIDDARNIHQLYRRILQHGTRDNTQA